MANDDKTKLTKTESKKLDETVEKIDGIFDKFDNPDLKDLGDDITRKMKKSAKNGKMMPIEMADGETIFLDTTGMKNSDIEEFKRGIQDFINGDFSMPDVRSSKTFKIKKTKADKSKSQKSSKLKK